jgi:hypothetical protein
MCSTRSAWTDGSRRAAIIAPRVALRSVYIYPENRNPSHLFINFSFRACLRDLDRSPCLLLHRPYSRPMHANVLVFLSGADSDIFALSFPPFFPHVLAVSMRFGSPVEFFFLCPHISSTPSFLILVSHPSRLPSLLNNLARP